jgi:hypothetical protein
VIPGRGVLPGGSASLSLRRGQLRSARRGQGKSELTARGGGGTRRRRASPGNSSSDPKSGNGRLVRLRRRSAHGSGPGLHEAQVQDVPVQQHDCESRSCGGNETVRDVSLDARSDITEDALEGQQE